MDLQWNLRFISGVGLALENIRHLMKEDDNRADINVGKAIEDLNATIRDLRTYILDLKPRQFRGGSLLESTQRLIEKFVVM